MGTKDFIALGLVVLVIALLIGQRRRRARLVERMARPVDRSTHEDDDPELLELIARKEAEQAAKDERDKAGQ